MPAFVPKQAIQAFRRKHDAAVAKLPDNDARRQEVTDRLLAQVGQRFGVSPGELLGATIVSDHYEDRSDVLYGSY